MHPQIRPAVVDDAHGLAVVHVASWRHAYAGLLPAEHLDALSVDSRAARWEEILGRPARPSALTLVAEVDGSVVGFSSIGPSRDGDADENTGELYALYLHPYGLGRGWGRALHQRAVQELRRAGARSATLWVLTGNVRALQFYERQGWTPDGLDKTDWRGAVRLDETRYRLSTDG